jgi:hypothetical protein
MKARDVGVELVLDDHPFGISGGQILGRGDGEVVGKKQRGFFVALTAGALRGNGTKVSTLVLG